MEIGNDRKRWVNANKELIKETDAARELPKCQKDEFLSVCCDTHRPKKVSLIDVLHTTWIYRFEYFKKTVLCDKYM